MSLAEHRWKVAGVVALLGCRSPGAREASHATPATVARRVAESSLTTVTLTPQAVSRLGIFLDPIADKIMVAAVILVLTAQGVLTGPYVGDLHVIAGLIILIREIAVSGLREFLGGIQVSVPVSRLAKWKTTFQFVALGALILGQGAPGWTVMVAGIDANVPHTVGLVTLWAAAVLTVITGWDYLRIGLKHMD